MRDLARGCRVAVAVMSVVTFAPLSAQATRELVHDVSFPWAFGYIGGIRALSNGRVIVADPLGQALVSIDLDAGSADTLGGIGAGPEEYRQPDAVFPLPGDSTLLTDLGNGRLTAVGPDGTFGETRPIPQEGSGGRLTIVLPRFVDSAGRIYYEPETFTAGGPADSAAIMRLDRSTGAVDSLGSVSLSPTMQRRVGGRVMLSRGPLRLRDDWAAGPDGRMAIVRAEDYSVEWIFGDGSTARGPANDYERVRVGRLEKEEWLEDQAVEAINVRATMSASGERNMQFSRGGGAGMGRSIDAYDWPDYLPPFRPRRSHVTPSGELWVQRFGNAGSAPKIEVFDARGRKTAELTLPLGRRVVGFGAGAYVFLARTDELGLQWLERYFDHTNNDRLQNDHDGCGSSDQD